MRWPDWLQNWWVKSSVLARRRPVTRFIRSPDLGPYVKAVFPGSTAHYDVVVVLDGRWYVARNVRIETRSSPYTFRYGHVASRLPQLGDYNDGREFLFWQYAVTQDQHLYWLLRYWQSTHEELVDARNLHDAYVRVIDLLFEGFSRLETALDGLRGNAKNYARLHAFVREIARDRCYANPASLCVALEADVRAPLAVGGRKRRG